jgi:prepilin-type N-terminal cleavage/methylation domain-containing protein
MEAAQLQHRSWKAGGFTLLELVLVMLLIAVMLAMAVPSLRGFLSNSRSRDAVSQIVSLAQWARARAAADSNVYRLNVNATSYWLTMQDGEKFIPIGTDFGRTFGLPEGIRIEVIPLDTNISSDAIDASGITFYPNGRSGTGMFRLTDAAGATTLIACPAPAESFRVVSPEEVARL